MSDIERFSIWKDEPSMDSWYSAAVTRDTENRKGIDTSDMQEVLFFDIGKSNQVKHPSDDVNDWFYGATERFETTISSKSTSPNMVRVTDTSKPISEHPGSVGTLSLSQSPRTILPMGQFSSNYY